MESVIDKHRCLLLSTAFTFGTMALTSLLTDTPQSVDSRANLLALGCYGTLATFGMAEVPYDRVTWQKGILLLSGATVAIGSIRYGASTEEAASDLQNVKVDPRPFFAFIAKIAGSLSVGFADNLTMYATSFWRGTEPLPATNRCGCVFTS
jgi:hypothetical protein